jgi:hypothetical protein
MIGPRLHPQRDACFVCDHKFVVGIVTWEGLNRGRIGEGPRGQEERDHRDDQELIVGGDR